MQTMLHFPDEESDSPRRPWSITRLNREAKVALASQLGTVWIEGEISNLRPYATSLYFNLKDETCSVSCVIFGRSYARAPELKDGMKVELSGEAGIFERRGQFQIVVERIQSRGAGELEARLRALQEKLRLEGLFDAARKRPLPPHPTRVGVVTSPAGAAIHDFLHILRRRAPHIEIVIAPVRVQGRGAATEIAAAVTDFSEFSRSGFPVVDVIVVTRGGGSLEDLWEFNEESVARAIAESRIPVIAAVGHETDVTTADLAADLRAPTPSAAAEILSTDRIETLTRLAEIVRRLAREVNTRLELSRTRLESRLASGAFQIPHRRLADFQQSTAYLLERSMAAVQMRLTALQEKTVRVDMTLRTHSPMEKLRLWRERLGGLTQRRNLAVTRLLQHYRQQTMRHAHALELLGPRQTLARGFTITMDGARRPLKSSAEAAKEKKLITLFADGGEVTSSPSLPE